jgi:outer membrane protein, heavy metal efflux system
MRHVFIFSALCGLFLCPAARAEVCPIASPQDVLACALRSHPDVIRASAELSSAQNLERVARQLSNPEVDAQTTSFDDADQPSLKVEANLLQTFELGGKRSKRAEEARARRQLAEIRLRAAQDAAALATTRNLYRLRQLGDEVQTLDESGQTFGKVVKAFKSRSALSAEQSVSLNVFTLAQSEYALRKSALLQERAALQAYFDTLTGAPFEKVLTALPPERAEWPTPPAVPGPAKSAAYQETENTLRVSLAQNAHASAGVWPDLRLGPRIETNSGHGQSSQGYGVALALPLPLYQRNDGERRLAKSQVEAARVALIQKDRELRADRQKWTAVYRQALTAYQAGPSLQDVHQKHHSLETLFERGLVSAPLVIEAHRQAAEYVKARHEQELSALEALWSIYALNGTILSERL